MFAFFTCNIHNTICLNLGNHVVRPISSQEAILILQKWSLEIQINDIVDMPEDGETDVRVTEDSLHGPFSLSRFMESENEDISNMKKVSNWLSYEHHRIQKSVFVSIIDNDEKMMALIEKKSNLIQVNGFIACPFIDIDTHKIAKSILALELLEMASKNDDNILFIFNI